MTIHALLTWWQHLSFSHGMIVLLVIVMAITLLCWMFATTSPPQYLPQGDWDVVDYSEAFQRKREQLGDDFLCAKPINRISGPPPC